MAPDLKTRIEERNRLADYYGKTKNPVTRTIGKAGLAIANLWDRMTAPLNSDGMALAEGATFGAMKGAVVGGVLGIAAGLVMGAVGVAMLPYALIPAAGGAILKGYQYGDYAVEQNSQNEKGKTARRIAEISGAVPSQTKLQATELREPRVKWTPPAEEPAQANAKSFVEDENRRRAARGPRVLN